TARAAPDRNATVLPSSCHTSPAIPHSPSSPTRRSSALARHRAAGAPARPGAGGKRVAVAAGHVARAGHRPGDMPSSDCNSLSARSEEHTSELQSRENLVCRLLLEKKKVKRQHVAVVDVA